MERVQSEGDGLQEDPDNILQQFENEWDALRGEFNLPFIPDLPPSDVTDLNDYMQSLELRLGMTIYMIKGRSLLQISTHGNRP